MSTLRRVRKITDFAKKASESEKESTRSPEHTSESSAEIEELLRARISRKEEEAVELKDVKKPSEPTREETTSTSSVLERLVLLAREAASKMQVEFVECDKQGNCSDGKRIGEVFEDSRGVKWQRGFLATSRLPIFLNFVAEESKIVGRIGRALVIETSRGAKAIIPEDYICELTSRYGVMLEIEKCANYKSSPWSEREGRSKKRV
ncbi:MAG: hypothetical protein ACO2OR_07370 [Desulfurococcaceae archaeon]